MAHINNFSQVRADGRIINDKMSLDELLARRWGPSIILKIQWETDGKDISINSASGLDAIIVSGGNYVAAIDDGPTPIEQGRLIIYSHTGDAHVNMPKTISINGHNEAGTYCWLEKSNKNIEDNFSAIFKRDRDGVLYRIEINAHDGSILSSKESR